MDAVRADILDAFRRQAAFCRDRDAHFTATVIEAAAMSIEAGGGLAGLLAGFKGDPGRGALALRIAGAIHRLVLEGRAEALGAIYAEPQENWSAGDIAPALNELTEANSALFRDYIARPPQTNEVRRAAVLLYGFSEIAATFHSPLNLYEIGASGGLLLAWDRFSYDYGAFRWGRADAVIKSVWRGAPPELIPAIEVRNRRGCDLEPLDFSDPQQRLRARSYIWPEEPVRLPLFDQAVEKAKALGVSVEKADALDWLEANLESNVSAGAARVVYHSVFDVYLSEAQRKRLDDIISAAGAKARAETPVAHLAFEIEEGPDGFEFFLDLQMWPGGEKKRLAKAHPHGAWVAPVDR